MSTTNDYMKLSHENKKNNNELSEFIKNNFLIPDNNLNDIILFIKNDLNIEKIIYDLPELIASEFPDDKLQITFFDDDYEKEICLDVSIFTSFSVEKSLKKQRKLAEIAYSKYNLDSLDKILLTMEY